MEIKQILKAFIGLLFILNSSAILAQCTAECTRHSCCSSSPDATPASVMISHVHAKGEWMLSYKYMNMSMNGILNGNQIVDKSDVFNQYLMSPETMRMDMHMLMGMFGLTDKLTVMAMVNYNQNTMDMSMFLATGHTHGGANDASMMHHMHTSGLGDLKLSVLYGLVNTPQYQLVLSAGVSVPVGSVKVQGTSDDVMYPNRRYPYAMQLGSGTFDVLPCVSYVFQKQNVSFGVQTSAVIRTNYNKLGYQLGNEATVNTWLAFQWLPCLSSSVRIEGNIADKIQGNDPTIFAFNEPSANPANYGGQRVSGAVGSVLQLREGFLKNSRLGVEFVLPVYQNLNGLQMKAAQTVVASWSMGF